MPVRFYLDHNVDRAVAYGLRHKGVDVLTALEDGSERLSDAALIDRAVELNRVVVSSDRDFIVEARRRQSDGIAFAGVIYVAQSTAVGTWVDQLELLAKVGEPDDFADTLLFLPFP